MKRVYVLALCFLFFLFSCENKIDFENVSFPPIPYSDSLNFVSSLENSKIYCFDASTDKIVGKYYINSGYVYGNLKSRNSPHVYIAIMNNIYKVDIASGKGIKITKNDLNIDSIRYYSSTEVMVQDLDSRKTSAIFSSNNDFRKVYNIGFGVDGFNFNGKDYIQNDTYGILYNLTDGTEIVLPKTDPKSSMGNDETYKFWRTIIEKNIIILIYKKDGDLDPYKVYWAYYSYSSLDGSVDLDKCEFIGEFDNDNYGWIYYYNGNLYGQTNKGFSKYNPATKVIETVSLSKDADPIFESGVTLGQDGSVFIGNALYCSLGNFKKTDKDMIVKVNLDDMTYKIIE